MIDCRTPFTTVWGFPLTISEKPRIDSLKNAASIATYGAFTYYSGNDSGGIPGAFPSKWYEGSALFIVALNYWHYTGDDTYNAITAEGLEWQSGPQGDYMPTNYSQFLVRKELPATSAQELF